jgi:hypothetical protein
VITNHDEYSLVREKAEEENEKPVPATNFGTLTLRRTKKDGDREIDPKMEQLKKKLKTEDESESSFLSFFPPGVARDPTSGRVTLFKNSHPSTVCAPNFQHITHRKTVLLSTHSTVCVLNLEKSITQKGRK